MLTTKELMDKFNEHEETTEESGDWNGEQDAVNAIFNWLKTATIPAYMIDHAYLLVLIDADYGWLWSDES